MTFQPADDFRRGLEFYARMNRLAVRLDPSVIAAATDEATLLAGDRVEDEPAALFFACVLAFRAFGHAEQYLLLDTPRNQAGKLGLRVDATYGEISATRRAILDGTVGWNEVRDWFRARLKVA